MSSSYRPPTAWQPPPPRNRHQARTVLLIILGAFGLLFAGCTTLAVIGAHDADTASKKVVAFGQPAHDGRFTFHIKGVRRADRIGDSVTGQDAQGEFLVVTVEVFNHGHTAQMFDASSQKLRAGGQTYDATNDLSSEAFLNNINPGNFVTANLAFDVPPGTDGEQVVLHDSPFSGGVRCALK